MASNTRQKNYGTGDPKLDLASRLIPGVRSRSAFGVNTDLDSGIEETVWNVGGLWTGLTAAQTLDIVSDNADDDAATGQGAWEVEILGLTSFDSPESLITERVSLDGITPVTTTNEFVFFCAAKVSNHGSSGVNVGTITFDGSVDATTQAQIDPLTGATRSAICGIPAGQTMFVTNFTASILRGSTSGEIDIQLKQDSGIHLDLTPNSSTMIHQIGLRGSGTSSFVHNFNPYFEVMGPAVVSLTAISNTNNTQMTGGFDLVVTDNQQMTMLRMARGS